MKKVIAVAAILTLCASAAFAQFAPQVLRVRGDAKIMKKDASEWIPVTEAMKVADGDTVKTGADGVVAIGFVESRKNLARIGNNTKAVILDGSEPTYAIDLLSGEVSVLALSMPQGSKFEITTPAGVSNAHGTGWRSKAAGDTAIFEAFDNSIYVNGLYANGMPMLESTFVNMGYMTTVKRFSAPGPTQRIPPGDIDLWNAWRDEVKDIMAKSTMISN